MGDVLLFSDLHLHPHKRRLERLEDCLKALEWVFETAKTRKIETILFGGDLFHDRQKIEVYSYQRAFETFQKHLNGSFKVYLLLGNHDLWFNDKTSVSSVVPFSAIPDVTIISEPTRLQIEGHTWDFIPYTHNPVETLETLAKMPGKPEYALGHIAVDGAVLHGNTYSDVVVEHDGDMVTVGPALFKKYKHVFLGHYHAEQKIGNNIEYIGSPLELSFGEAFQKKHLIVFGDEKEYIENDFSPRHLIIDIKDADKFDLNRNFVRIKVDNIGATDLVAMRKEILDKNNVCTLEIKQEKTKTAEHVVKDAKAILAIGDEMLARYMDEVGHPELERKTLLNIGKKICQKTE